MATAQIATESWLKALIETASEVSGMALGLDLSVLDEAVDIPEEQLWGSYLSLAAENVAAQIGFISNHEGCQLVVKNMLGMQPSDDDLPSEDTADALGEIVNMMAGGVKKRLIAQFTGLQLGLPVFINGYVQPSGMQEPICARIQLGTAEAYLLVLKEST